MQTAEGSTAGLSPCGQQNSKMDLKVATPGTQALCVISFSPGWATNVTGCHLVMSLCYEKDMKFCMCN